MNIDEAAIILKEMHDGAPPRETSISVILFGIKYAHELEGISASALVARAGLKKSYNIEVNYGKRLAKYVEII